MLSPHCPGSTLLRLFKPGILSMSCRAGCARQACFPLCTMCTSFCASSGWLVLDRGHGPRMLTACCDGSVSAEVIYGSRLREDPRLLLERSVTSCQLGRESCQCQLWGASECWPRGKGRAAPGSPSLYPKDREREVWGNCPHPYTIPQRSRCTQRGGLPCKARFLLVHLWAQQLFLY